MDKAHRLPISVSVAAAFLAVGAIWGSAWIPTQALSHSLPELLTGAWRFALAAIVLAVPALGIRLRTPVSQRRPVVPLLVPAAALGAAMLAVPYALTVWAAGRVSPGLVALCFALMPLCVLLFGREEGGGGVTVVVLGIGGVAMVVAPGISLGEQQLPGAIALLVAMGLGGYSLLYVRRLHTQGLLKTSDILPISAIQLAVACVILVALLASSRQQFVVPLNETAALPLTLLAVVVSAGTLPLLYWLLGRIAAWQAGTLQWMATLVAVAEAAFFLGVRPALEAWIGAALIPTCIFWIFLSSRGNRSSVTLEITEHTLPATKASNSRTDGE